MNDKKEEIERVLKRWRNPHCQGKNYTGPPRPDKKLIENSLVFYLEMKDWAVTLGHGIFWTVVFAIVLCYIIYAY